MMLSWVLHRSMKKSVHQLSTNVGKKRKATLHYRDEFLWNSTPGDTKLGQDWSCLFTNFNDILPTDRLTSPVSLCVFQCFMTSVVKCFVTFGLTFFCKKRHWDIEGVGLYDLMVFCEMNGILSGTIPIFLLLFLVCLTQWKHKHY